MNDLEKFSKYIAEYLIEEVNRTKDNIPFQYRGIALLKLYEMGIDIEDFIRDNISKATDAWQGGINIDILNEMIKLDREEREKNDPLPPRD